MSIHLPTGQTTESYLAELERKGLISPGCVRSSRLETVPASTAVVAAAGVRPAGFVQVSLPIPPSVNHLWGKSGSKFYRKPHYNKWLRQAEPIWRSAMHGQLFPFAVPVEITIEICGGKGWRQGRDLDNVAKVIADSAKHAGIVVDDNTDNVRRYVLTFEPAASRKSKAECVVTVRPLCR